MHVAMYMYCPCTCISCFRANSFAERLRLHLAVIHGDSKAETEDGRNSPPPFEALPPTPSKSCKSQVYRLVQVM